MKRLTNGTKRSTDNSLPSFSASSEWGLEVWFPLAVLAPEQTEPNPQVPLGRDTKTHDYLSTKKNPARPNTLCSFEDSMSLFRCACCTCQCPKFSECLWSPCTDWTKGLRSGQTACECLHLFFSAGQWGLPQERHGHAAVSGGKKIQSQNNPSVVQRTQACQKISKLQRNNNTARRMQLVIWPEVVGAHSFHLRGIQTADQMAKCCQINSC